MNAQLNKYLKLLLTVRIKTRPIMSSALLIALLCINLWQQRRPSLTPESADDPSSTSAMSPDNFSVTIVVVQSRRKMTPSRLAGVWTRKIGVQLSNTIFQRHRCEYMDLSASSTDITWICPLCPQVWLATRMVSGFEGLTYKRRLQWISRSPLTVWSHQAEVLTASKTFSVKLYL